MNADQNRLPQAPKVPKIAEIENKTYHGGVEQPETWSVIIRAFEQIISALNKLQKMGVLSDDYVTEQDTLTNDLWAKANTQILKKVSEREEDDRNHYGKMRATIERRIRGRQ